MTAQPPRKDRHGRIPFPRVVIDCRTCGEPFTKIRSNHRFCSMACWHPPDRPPEDFWARVDKSGDCWPWLGRKNKKGYGKFQATYAHRYSWGLSNGSPAPDDIQILHSCDNPPCVRPDHLFPGTAQDNSDDMMAKGRSASGDKSFPRLHPEKMRRGERIAWSILKESDVHLIRALRSNGFAVPPIAQRFGVTVGTLTNLLKGVAWKAVPDLSASALHLNPPLFVGLSSSPTGAQGASSHACHRCGADVWLTALWRSRYLAGRLPICINCFALISPDELLPRATEAIA